MCECVSVVAQSVKYVNANSQEQTVVHFLYGSLCSEDIQVENF